MRKNTTYIYRSSTTHGTKYPEEICLGNVYKYSLGLYFRILFRAIRLTQEVVANLKGSTFLYTLYSMLEKNYTRSTSN